MYNLQEFGLHEPKKFPYFEGWYIRGMQEDLSFSCIIGLQYQATSMVAFIQFMDTYFHESRYVVFEETELEVTNAPFALRLGENVLKEHQLILHLQDVDAELRFSTWTHISSNHYMPTIMGPFAYLPMECSHAIISLRHQIQGSLSLGMQSFAIDAIGYMEKDRGTSFPKRYIWFQASHPIKETSLFLSIASIPLPVLSFTGLIAVLMIKGKQYRFASYLGAHLTHSQLIQKDGNLHVYLSIQQGNKKLRLHLIQQDICELHAPYEGHMNLKIKESLNSEGHLMFSIKNQIIEELTLYDAGLEIVGFEKR